MYDMTLDDLEANLNKYDIKIKYILGKLNIIRVLRKLVQISINKNERKKTNAILFLFY